MPDLLKFLARNLVMGTLAGWVSLAALIGTNTRGLGDIVFASSNPVLPIALLAFGFFITFGSLAMGAAIMMLPYKGDEGKSSGLKVHTLLATLQKMMPRLRRSHELIPVPVEDKSKRSKYYR